MPKCVIITVKDKNGKVEKRLSVGESALARYLKSGGDLGTNFFGEFLKALFTSVSRYGYATFNVTDINNTGRGYYTHRSVASGDILTDTYYCDVTPKIMVGDSTTASTRSQYKLQGTVLGTSNTTANYITDSGYVDVSASFSWAEDKTVYEIGLFLYAKDTSNTGATFMLDRTVFADGIVVTAGKYLNVDYRIAI